MGTRSRLLTLLAVGVLLACSSVRTHYDYDPSADFSPWQRFAWYPVDSFPTGDPRLDNPLLHRTIEGAIERRLDEMGFAKADLEDADFYVNFHLSTQERLEVRSMNRRYLGPSASRAWRGGSFGGSGWNETVVTEYEEGTLVIDLLDIPSRRLVWRGSGTRRLARNPRRDRVAERVEEAVDEVLGQFPPGS